MEKRLKVVWTENAIQDLSIIKKYIAEDSLDRSERWIEELLEAGESLGTLASRGRLVPEFDQENLRELLIGNYRLVYRLSLKLVEILTVFEGHRQFRKDDIKG